MYKNSDCPDRQTLRNWANGSLDDSQAAVVESHLDDCEKCDQYASGIQLLDKSDLLQGNHGYVGEEECAEAMERIVIGGADEQIASPIPRAATVGHGTLTGTRIRDYQLVRQLGKGGMGTVYLASHVQLRKEVAIKVVRSQVSHSDPNALARFKREMRAVGQLDHPNIVRALDAGDDEGLYFLAMELVEGVDLSDLSKGKRSLSVEDACEIIRQAATGLQYVHEQGLVHRDIKPSNIMLSARQGEPVCVKILDLGLALLPEGGSVEIPLTAESQLVGTLEYMAPEQAEGCENLDYRVDIYSLGVTLYRLLTGSIPFRGPKLRNPLNRLKALTSTAAPSLASRRSDLPQPLVAVVDQMLNRDPALRPESMSEVVNRLSQFCPSSPLKNIPDTCVDTDLDTIDFSNARQLIEADTSPTECETVIEQAVLGNSHIHNNTLRRKSFLVAALAIGIMICAGVLWLKTDGAYVLIEAEPNVDFTVEVIDSDTNKNVDSFQVGQGRGSFWLETGQYRIQLPQGEDDNLTLDSERLTVTRGAKLIVQISRVTADQHNTATNTGSTNVMSHPEVGDSLLKPGEAATFVNSAGWKWTKTRNLGAAINTEWKDDQPTLSTDGLTMIFGSYCIPRFTGEGDRDLWMVTRPDVNATWSAVTNLGPTINSPMKETHPAFHQATQTLIFSSNRGGGIGGVDLWFSNQADDEKTWSRPVNLGPNANSEFDDDNAEISSDGLTLYFTSNRPATTSGKNIWYCTRKSIDDRWGLPRDLTVANSNRHEFAPALSSDQLTLVFCSERNGGYGGKDLWAATRNSLTEEWQVPFNLGDQINSPAEESHATFGRNDQTLIFSSDRESGQGANDLWTASRRSMSRIAVPTAMPIGNPPPIAKIPFEGDQARVLQQQWGDHLQLPVSHTNSIGMTFRLIPPGEFQMGASEDEFQRIQKTKWASRPSPMNPEYEAMLMDTEWPQRMVTLTKAVYIGSCEVREQDFDRVLGIRRPMQTLGLNFPVGMVSWIQAAKFCNELSKTESMPLRYTIDGRNVEILDQEFGYRLPTEAEWEFACRAGSATEFPFKVSSGNSDQQLDDFAWYNTSGTDSDLKLPAHQVGLKKPNAFGLWDMLGNHWEWCEDSFLEQRNLPEPWVDPMFHDASSPRGIARGGFVLSIPEDLRSARRRRHLKHMVYRHGGFRIVLIPKPPVQSPAD